MNRPLSCMKNTAEFPYDEGQASVKVLWYGKFLDGTLSLTSPKEDPYLVYFHLESHDLLTEGHCTLSPEIPVDQIVARVLREVTHCHLVGSMDKMKEELYDGVRRIN